HSEPLALCMARCCPVASVEEGTLPLNQPEALAMCIQLAASLPHVPQRYRRRCRYVHLYPTVSAILALIPSHAQTAAKVYLSC
ncbi:hypothetical protein KIPB_015800, partial [Kipferlia bialata]